ncbi:MAG: T9SS type A sorting domain-containing protein, partial [Chitinophagales bacterium]
QADLEWEKSFGGTSWEKPSKIIQTKDGGFIVVGYSMSNDGDVTGHHGDVNCLACADYWVVKLDNGGNLEWENSFGSNEHDHATDVVETIDSGYIVAGHSFMHGCCSGDVTDHHGGFQDYQSDYWLVRLDQNGNIKWKKSYGGSDSDWAYSIINVEDNKFIIVGASDSNDDDVSDNKGQFDGWIVKIDSLGNILSQNNYGGSGYDVFKCIIQTKDKGYSLVGFSDSQDGDVGASNGQFDYWIMKLDSNFEIQWSKTLGGSGTEEASSIVQLSEGGFLVAGYSYSDDIDVTGNHKLNDISSDYWIIKLDAEGNVIWKNCYGGTGNDIATALIKTADDKFCVVGYSDSKDGDVQGNYGDDDFWALKLDTNGAIISQLNLGGSGGDGGMSIIQSFDQSYIGVAFSSSSDHDVAENHGIIDFWITKFSTLTSIKENEQGPVINPYPNPSTGIFKIYIQNINSQTKVEVYNQLSRKVFSSKDNFESNIEINLSSEPSGIYLVQIQTNGHTLIGKLVINK